MCCKNLQTALSASAACFDERLSAMENGRKFRIELPKNSPEKFCRIKIDGCLIPQNSSQQRCDYLFFRCTTKDLHFVELKGKNLKKGVAQIASTIKLLREALHFSPNQVHGHIVSSRSPLSSTELQNLKNEFRKNHGKTLQIKSGEHILQLLTP